MALVTAMAYENPACALQAGLSMFSYVLVVPIRNQNSRFAR